MGCQQTGMMSSKDTQQDTVAVKVSGRYGSHVRLEGMKASSLVQFRGCGIAIRNPGEPGQKE